MFVVFRFTTYQDACRVNILRVSPVKFVVHGYFLSDEWFVN